MNLEVNSNQTRLLERFSLSCKAQTYRTITILKLQLLCVFPFRLETFEELNLEAKSTGFLVDCGKYGADFFSRSVYLSSEAKFSLLEKRCF